MCKYWCIYLNKTVKFGSRNTWDGSLQKELDLKKSDTPLIDQYAESLHQLIW